MSNKPKTYYEDNLVQLRDNLVELLVVDFAMSLTDVAFIFKISKQRVSKIISNNNKK